MPNIFSQRLKKLRIERKLSQKEIGDVLNVRDRQIQNYEYGKQLPSIDKLITLADFFNVSIDYLVGRDSHIKYVDSDRQNLNNEYDKLNDLGREEAVKRLRELAETPKYIRIQPQTVKVACRGAGIQEIDIEIIKRLLQDAEKNKDKNIDDLF